MLGGQGTAEKATGYAIQETCLVNIQTAPGLPLT